LDRYYNCKLSVIYYFILTHTLFYLISYVVIVFFLQEETYNDSVVVVKPGRRVKRINVQQSGAPIGKKHKLEQKLFDALDDNSRALREV
jgi:hypothetical protein